ncbi:hypothetical protein [Xylocopilactobacillus apicola]|uniref:Uncharacterized protein n=1 Tax=Xylocopilactobacillus apicola TaxID=2932184 RepID=A0AAU9DH97_9LACO|nr:hypothetical protein [Xylocopilactobacillus apicola]BDR59370.1 hypothetical protein XA3_18110 [Xylocopilactobacillus apicola]
MENNINIKKVWQDSDLLQLSIIASAEFVLVKQLCYIEKNTLRLIGEKIKQYSYDFKENCYVQFGELKGNYTPGFSLDFLAAHYSGNVKIEVDMEIDDNDEWKHRCRFYVNS